MTTGTIATPLCHAKDLVHKAWALVYCEQGPASPFTAKLKRIEAHLQEQLDAKLMILDAQFEEFLKER